MRTQGKEWTPFGQMWRDGVHINVTLKATKH